MKNYKELYDKVDVWYKKQSRDTKERIFDKNSYQRNNFQELLLWYDEINEWDEEVRNYFLGVKKITLDVIKDYMLNRLIPDVEWRKESYFYDNPDADEDGHCSLQLYNRIIEFWKELNENKILCIANGSCKERYGLNINGYRDHFLQCSGVLPLIFSYIFYNCNYDYERFQKNLYNSLDETDDLNSYFIDFEIPTDEELDKLTCEVIYNNDGRAQYNFKSEIEKIIKDFEYNPTLTDKIEILKQLIK